jgi:type II secretory pathway pseudopilin PulG
MIHSPPSDRSRGASLVELLVALLLLSILASGLTTLFVGMNGTFAQETTRQVASGEARLALETTVRRLREGAVRVVRVNLSLDDAAGRPLLRDGLVLWTDSEHRTVYVDRDPATSPGHGLPDQVGWDDRDGDGLADVLVLGLQPQDADRDGQQDVFTGSLGAFADGRPDRVVLGDGTVVEGNRKWLLVLARFGSLAAALDPTRWREPQVLARNVVPRLSVVAGVLQLETIEVEGRHPESYDYGHDGDWDLIDAGQEDGVVDEVEIARAANDNQLLDSQDELDLIATIRVRLTTGELLRGRRLALTRSVTAVSPRAFEIVDRMGLRYPTPS